MVKLAVKFIFSLRGSLKFGKKIFCSFGGNIFQRVLFRFYISAYCLHELVLFGTLPFLNWLFVFFLKAGQNFFFQCFFYELNARFVKLGNFLAVGALDAG